MMQVALSPATRCPVELSVLVVAAFSFLWIWVALGRGHWFLRSTVACLLTLTLLPAAAFEPLIFLTLVGVVSAVPLVIARWLLSRRELSRRGSLDDDNRMARLLTAATAGVASVVVVLMIEGGLQPYDHVVSRTEKLFSYALLLPATCVAVFSLKDRVRLGRWRFRPRRPNARFSLRESMGVTLLLGLMFSAFSYSFAHAVAFSWQFCVPIVMAVSSLNVLLVMMFASALVRWKVVALSALLLVLTWATFYEGVAGAWLLEATYNGWMGNGLGKASGLSRPGFTSSY
ncbi:MAG: hypothetical protein AAFX06_09800 [Planctomycetota bacterium]